LTDLADVTGDPAPAVSRATGKRVMVLSYSSDLSDRSTHARVSDGHRTWTVLASELFVIKRQGRT
jgi:hypothetical protein